MRYGLLNIIVWSSNALYSQVHINWGNQKPMCFTRVPPKASLNRVAKSSLQFKIEHFHYYTLFLTHTHTLSLPIIAKWSHRRFIMLSQSGLNVKADSKNCFSTPCMPIPTLMQANNTQSVSWIKKKKTISSLTWKSF